MASFARSSTAGPRGRPGLARANSSTSNSSNSSSGGGGSTGSSAPRRAASSDLNALSLDTDEDFDRLLASYDVPAAIDALRRFLAVEVQTSVTSVVGAGSKQQSAQIKRKFYERFNQILDRIFGNDDVSKHKYGGWMDYSAGVAPLSAAPTASASSGSASSAASSLPLPRNKRMSSSSGIADSASLSPEQADEQRLQSYVASLTASGRALTEFLGYLKEEDAGSIFPFLFKMTHPVEFKVELDLLPEQSKLSIMSRSAFTSVLFTQLLQKPILKQRIDPREPVLLVTIKELFLFYFMRHPASANHQSSAATADASAATSLMGSLSDTFTRPKRRTDFSWRGFFSDGVVSLTRGNPYNVLLLQYLKVFFPDSSKPVQSRFRGKILQFSNLFLHVLIEFWLRQNLIVFASDASNLSSVDSSLLYRAPQRLASPFAAVHTQTTYMAPSDDLLSSLVLTIIHLLSDSFFPASLDAATSTQYSGMAVGSGGGYLTPSITVLRRPLYEFLRLVFSRAPIGLSPAAFFAITDVWLAYIQPWNCRAWSQGQAPVLRRSPSDSGSSSTGSNVDAPAGYTPAWETFVLANYHFYTTLLGAFVERAKELDLTGGDERAIATLDRVLAVFNPDLLALLRQASEFLDKNQPYTIPTTSAPGFSARQTRAKSTDHDGLSPAQGQVLTYYCKALGLECVGVPLHASYHRDAERLFDKLWTDSGFSGASDSTATSVPTRSPRPSGASAMSWFGQSSGESPLDRVSRLSRQLRRVFEISDAYVASTAHARSLSGSASAALEPMFPSRHLRLRHLLTREGIVQLCLGQRVCSPDEVEFIGDPMLRPIRSYEVAMLVRLSYRVSTWLNQQLGLRSPYRGKHYEDNVHVDPVKAATTFRFNLRFLASKPNLVFLGVFVALFYLLLLW
ncbi:hypothetical protein P43SY_006446 [Pythium insidiosum]|uniref:Sphingomyelin phosphodiesterase 4 n=1 Tax=Pythium insidiosum TaxID=114742 RepID=A0AAD5QEI2_PYTIN|nr:hypothetical protein P43SY_006446 [Pythium insidiosum]